MDNSQKADGDEGVKASQPAAAETFKKDDLVWRLREQAGWYSDGHGPLHGEAADRIEELEAECFKLAAGVCEHRGGDDYGNPLCLKTNRPI
jgi:hypothetical protein